MINNFKIFEKKMLLESILNVHPNFMSILSDISIGGDSISKIALKVFNAISEEDFVSSIDLKTDYYNIVDGTNDKLSFIQTNRVKGDLDPYLMNGRSEVKVGRAIKYMCDLYDISLTNKEVEEFVNKYKSFSESSTTSFKFYEGKKIIDGYDSDNYLFEFGTLGDSCMNDESDYFDIYVKNKDKVRLLVLLKDKSIIGRSIIWKMDESPCDAEYLMDRVYTNYDHDINTFIEYAEKNGWLYKQKMSYGRLEAVKFRYKRSDVYGCVSIKLKGDHDEYPFLDTMQFLSKDKNMLTNFPTWKCKILNDTDGDYWKCFECSGKSKNSALCFDCCVGVKFLKSKGIKANVEIGRKKK